MKTMLMPTPTERRPQPRFRQKRRLPASSQFEPPGLEVLIFQIGEDLYAFRADRIITTLNLGMTAGRIWRVLHSNLPFFRHFFAYQDQIMPLVDLRRLWKIPHDVYNLETPIIAVQLAELAIGFFVDSVKREDNTSLEVLQPLPPAIFANDSAYFYAIYSVDDQLVALCNEQTLLTPVQREYLRLAYNKLLDRQKEKPVRNMNALRISNSQIAS